MGDSSTAIMPPGVRLIVAKALMESEPPYIGCEWDDLETDDEDRAYYLERADAALNALLKHHAIIPRTTISEVPGMMARVDAAFSHEARETERDDLYAIYRWAGHVHRVANQNGSDRS